MCAFLIKLSEYFVDSRHVIHITVIRMPEDKSAKDRNESIEVSEFLIPKGWTLSETNAYFYQGGT